MLEIDLTERDWKVLEYIRKNSGCSKQDVVRGMKGDPSRITVLNILNKLEEYKMIYARKKKPNSQIYNLFINNDNLLITTQQQVDDFKKLFLTVLEKAKEKIDMKENIDQQSTKIPKEVRNTVGSPTPSTPILQNKAYLLHALLMLYSHIIGVYLIAALFTWPSKIKDKEDLNKLNTLIFSDIKEVQSKLSDVLPKIDGNADDDNPLINIMLDGLYGLYPHALTYVTKAFENYGLKKELEPIMELLLKTTFDLLPHQTLTNFLKYTSPRRTPIQNWRDYIEVVKMTSNLEATLKGVLKGHSGSLKK